MNYTDVIFENYASFLESNHEMVSSPRDAMQMLSTDASFYSYIDSLTENLDPEIASTMRKVCERERECILENSANVGASSSAIGFSVAYFPILIDIYSEPVLSQAVNVMPVSKGMITIPRITVTSSVKNPDATVTTNNIPRENVLARGAAETINVLPNVSNDLFTLSAGNANGMTTSTNRVNKRYLVVTAINVTDTAGGGSTYDVAVGIRPDARGHFRKTVVHNDTAGAAVTYTIMGDVVYDNGTMQYSVTHTGGTGGATYTTNHVKTNVIFSPITGDIGRVKVKLVDEGWDVNIDVKDDFEIDLQTETIQDFRDIYNIDIVRTLSSAIKQQIMLNKDFDISYFLQAAETDMASLGASASVDLALFKSGGSKGVQPEDVQSIFKSVLPSISSVSAAIRRNHRADPQYLLTGYRAGALLQSMQAQYFNFADGKHGVGGKMANAISFQSQTVITSGAIPDDKIYVVYKAPGDDLSRSAIIDLLYNPLYIVSEITNSVKRDFVKSRTALELARPEAVGVVNLLNATNYLL